MENIEDKKYITMTTRPVGKLILKLAVPTILSMLITAFYNLADTFFVGQLNDDSNIAAVGVILPLMSIIQAIGFFFGQGSGSFISRAYGSKDLKPAEEMSVTAFVYAVVVGIIFMAFGLIFQRGFVIVLGAKTESTISASISYMFYILLATPFLLGSIVINNQLRFQGNAYFAMFGLITGAVLNIILDPIFIFGKGDLIFNGMFTCSFGLGMGISGAALATALSQLVSFVLLLIGMFKSDSVKINFKKISFDKKYIYGIIQGGLPSLLRQGLASIATASLNHAIGAFTVYELIDSTQAGMTGAFKITNFIASAMIGFGQGFQPVCGINYGAKKYNRVLDGFWYSVKFIFICLIVIGVVFFIYARPIVKFILGVSDVAAEIATISFRSQLVVLPFVSFTVLSNMMYQTIGRLIPASVIAILRQGVVFIPLVFLLPIMFNLFGFGYLLGIELAQSIADVVSLIVAIIVFNKENKKLKELEFEGGSNVC